MRRSDRRGQALVVAIFVLAFLTAIAIAFYTSTTMQLRRAVNVTNRVQAAQAAEAGIAMAQAFLRHDAVIHNTYTSYDFAFRTYFNGAAFAGKDWAFPPVLSAPLTPPSTVPKIPGTVADDLGDRLYIPKLQGDDPDVDPYDFTGVFAVDQAFGALTPPEQINVWADVDNNEDGQRDSVWLPVPQDVFFLTDGIDNNLDGLVDESPWMDEDGIDNTGDGLIDDQNEIDLAKEVEPERAIFVYFGGNDGLDNNGDGQIDEPAEQKLFLTTRLPDGQGGWLGSGPDFIINVRVNPDAPDFPEALLSKVQGDPPYIPVSNLNDVDVLDNDYDLVVNNTGVYAFDHPSTDPGYPWTPIRLWGKTTREENMEHVLKAYNEIDTSYLTALGLPADYHLTIEGEPVCRVVGRVAVLIEDATAKANINKVHGLAPNYGQGAGDGFNQDRMVSGGTATGPAIARNLGQGLDPSEWDARVLPDSGHLKAGRLAQMRAGAPEGAGFRVDETTLPNDPLTAPFAYDAGFPGYGRVDDNGNALWASISGIDWNASGWPYDGVIPYDYLGLGAFQFPNLQGVDEPQEYSPYRPRRNLVAENDGINNDLALNPSTKNQLTDEFGELGDWYYRTKHQLELASGIGPITALWWRPLTIAHSFSRNDRHRFFEPDGTLLEEPEVSGLRLDYNYAFAEQIDAMLSRDWAYTFGSRLAPLGLPVDAEAFSLGLLRENAGVVPVGMSGNADPLPQGILGNLIGDNGRFPADLGLRRLQLAANLVDRRDADHAQTQLTLSVPDDWWNDQFGGYKRLEYTAAGIESIRINELMVRPVRRVEAEMRGGSQTKPTEPYIQRRLYYQELFKFDFNAPAEPEAIPSLDPNHFSYPHDPRATDFLMRMENFKTHADYRNRNKIADYEALTGVSFDSGWNIGGPLPHFLGNRAYVHTTSRYLTGAPETAYELGLTEPPPDVVQFLFAPSVQLPPGRYYLLISTLGEDGLSTTPQAWNLEYAVKYCVRNPAPANPDNYPMFSSGKVADWDDILYDVFDQFYPEDVAAPNPPVPWQKLDPYAMGDSDFIRRPDEAQLVGKVFLPTQLARNPAPAIPGYQQDEAYTVEIPPVSGDPNEQIFLCVAFKMGSVLPPDGEIAINFFEFSQEPDHEWIELVNIAEAPDYADLNNPALRNATLALDDADRQRWAEMASVDVSGWQIEIGYEGDIGHATMRIPEGTFIAPGGSLLVGVNKYDYLESLEVVVPDPGPGLTPLIYQNGIGLAGGPVRPWLANVTVPPIPNPVLNGVLGLGLESVFYRAADVDFVDWPDTFWEDWLQSTIDPVLGPAPDKAWDRIVEAHVSLGGYNDPYSLFMAWGGNGTSGGQTFTAFPPMNPPGPWYPNMYVGAYLRQFIAGEFVYWRIVANTIDTLSLEQIPGYTYATVAWPVDGPWAIVPETALSDLRQLALLLLRGGILPNYPEHDGIDNDGDGMIDENRPEKWDPNPGHWYAPAAPGQYSIFSVDYGYSPDYVAYWDLVYGDMLPSPDNPDHWYLGTWRDHPEWKAFVERRMAPGDLVVVTLYDGPGEDRKAVDRVTYSEKDVVNRAIDDVKEYPRLEDPTGTEITSSFPLPGVGTVTYNARPVLDPRFPTWWPDDTMGIDFYRSLPRKHPFYTGDRFGDVDRWTATDGAYDDWAPSFGPWKDASTHWLEVPGAAAEYGHAFWGTPLRKNVFERMLNLGPTGGVLDPDPLTPDWDLDFGGWALGWQTVRNRAFSSPQQVLEMPHLMMREQLTAGTDYAFARNVAERALVGQPELHAYDMVTATPDVKLSTDAVALADSMTGDSIVLTCAQADFYPLVPSPADIDAAAGGADYHRWGSGTTYLPNAWVPIFLHPLGEAVAMPATDVFLEPYHWQPAIHAGGIPEWRVQLNFLLAQPHNFPPGVTAADLALRWPLWDRPVTFVSANMPNFDPRMDRNAIDSADLDARPAEALFVWDADDGLEDGEYDVYVITGDVELDLLRWGQEIAQMHSTNLTDLIQPGFGQEFMNRLNTRAAYLDNLAVDIEFFTDRGKDVWDGDVYDPDNPDGVRDEGYGDGKVWEDRNGNFFPEPEELCRDQNEESFGMKYGATPNPEGVIHYGIVKVENNYLALFIRNWAPPGMLNRFSRVVLAPRARSHGRININTAQMSPFTHGGASHMFNPLMGIPGVLAEFDAGTGQFSFRADTDNYGPSHTAVVAARELAARLVEGRYVWPDGRYYRSVGDLVAYDTGTLGTPEGPSVDPPLLGRDPGDPWDPVTEEDFLELIGRYGRMANLISTHSDVFEIYVTAEAGYISNEDMNNDGQWDWRHDFVTTAQKKVRIIYER